MSARRGSGHLVVSGVAGQATRRAGEQWNAPGSKPGWGGVYAGQRLSFASLGKATVGLHQGQNRIRENRPSGIAGRLVETWAKETAIWARTAETPRQTSRRLRLTRATFLSRRSGRQGRDLAGESPAVLVARVEHVAMPHPGIGNEPGDAWCKRPDCPVETLQLHKLFSGTH